MKVGVIGAGNVGVGVVDALVSLGVAKEVIFYNRTLEKVLGEVWDLNDAIPLLNGTTEIFPTNKLEDLQGCDVIVITIGAKQKPGESRIDLLNKNSTIFQDLIQRLDEIDLRSKILIVTNPVDILTRAALALSKRDKQLIFGSGTVLDTSRLKEELGLRLGINRKNVHSYVVGEHGDSEFVLWSISHVGPVMLEEFGLSVEEKEEIARKVRERAYAIIEKKGFTKQAIGVAVAKIVQAILYDEKSVFTLSTPIAKSCADISQSVVLSQPCIVGKGGIEQILMLDCNFEEFALLKKSAQKLDEVYQSITFAS